MKTILSVLILGTCLGFSVLAQTKPTVKACTFESMKPLVTENIRQYVLERMQMKGIEVDQASLRVAYEGQMDFRDYHFAGTKSEHGFSVSFTSKKGTPFVVFSAIEEFQGSKFVYTEPLHQVVSIPEPTSKTTHDNEGNVTGETCTAFSHGGYNRWVLFVNTSTNKLVEADLVSFSQVWFAHAEVK